MTLGLVLSFGGEIKIESTPNSSSEASLPDFVIPSASIEASLLPLDTTELQKSNTKFHILSPTNETQLPNDFSEISTNMSAEANETDARVKLEARKKRFLQTLA